MLTRFDQVNHLFLAAVLQHFQTGNTDGSGILLNVELRS